MSALEAAIEGAALGATQIGLDYLKRKLQSGGSVVPTQADARELGKQLIGQAVATGASLDDLRDELEAAGVRRQEALFEAAKLAEIGEPSSP